MKIERDHRTSSLVVVKADRIKRWPWWTFVVVFFLLLDLPWNLEWFYRCYRLAEHQKSIRFDDYQRYRIRSRHWDNLRNFLCISFHWKFKFHANLHRNLSCLLFNWERETILIDRCITEKQFPISYRLLLFSLSSTFWRNAVFPTFYVIQLLLSSIKLQQLNNVIDGMFDCN